MKTKNSAEQIQANLQMLADASTDLINKEESYNLLIIQTPTGKIKIRSKLTGPEWLLEQQMRMSNLSTKKKKRK